MKMVINMMLEESFEKAARDVHTLSYKPPNEVLLKLYALYKQATEGNVKGEKPGGFNFKGAAKYEAWSAQQGKSKVQAMKEYIELVEQLIAHS